MVVLPWTPSDLYLHRQSQSVFVGHWQVPRILNPVVLVLDELPKLCRDPTLNAYVASAFGSMEACRCGCTPV